MKISFDEGVQPTDMDGIASSSAKVEMNYYVTACAASEEADCLAVLNEYRKFGYIYVTTIHNLEDVLIIFKKPKGEA